LSADPRSAGSVFRRLIAALILVPLAIVIIAFAVANRQDVTISLDPFGGSAPAASVTQPLFVVILAVLIIGVLVGGIASWLRHGRWRRMARRFEREAHELRAELDRLKRAADGVPVQIPETTNSPERLQLRPPVH
jgi:uncharacterized integral membrane protein